MLQGLGPTYESFATNTARLKCFCQVQLQVGGGDCAEVTLVTLEVILRGVVIGQDVVIELQWVDSFNYFKLLQFFGSSF